MSANSQGFSYPLSGAIQTPAVLPLRFTVPIQAKLKVGAVNDPLEHEADRVADQVLGMAAPEASIAAAPPQISRKCESCEEEDRKLPKKSAGPQSTADEVPGLVHEVLRSPGQPLDPTTRYFMESRFGHDFSSVRVHSGAAAGQSAQDLSAHAYTVGHNIEFGAGRFALETHEGRRLLAHELTHVVQQGGVEVVPAEIRIGDPSGAAESEADRVAANSAAGASLGAIRSGTPTIARFSDTGHHAVEEAALAGAGFSESQMKAIEKGNVQRDYSQVGWVGNTALLCRPSEFGGYRPEEHFDNYMWDAVTGGWRTRGGSGWREQGIDVGKTPIDFISSQLEKLANRGVTDAGLEHLGNAFHTTEDFFAHSNFVELMQGDTSHGATLITGNPVGPSQSVSRIFEAITPPGVRERYRQQSEEAISVAAPGTHTAMAHDDPTTTNYTLARRLAALVIQELGTEVLAVMAAPEPERPQLMRERVVAKVTRYLRPPDPKDKWWESLTAIDAGRIDRRLDEAARRTPITVNQCALSPLKNLEASQNSPLALPIGVAIPTIIRGNRVWFQVGGGVVRQIPFEPIPGGSPRDERGNSLVVGAQVTGAF